MSRSLPPSPSLEHLKKEAKELLRDHRLGTPEAFARLRLLPRFANATDAELATAALPLAEAQQAVAMNYGFKNWNTLRKLVTEAFTPDPDLPPAEYYEDYRWSNGQPLGIGRMDKPRMGNAFFKFIRSQTGVRVEHYDARRAFIGICHDPADRELGDRKIAWREEPMKGGAVRLDASGRVRTYERYFILSKDEPPQVKAEIYNADGRLIATHTPRRLSETAEDIYVTDRLGKLKVILHHRGINKGEPCEIHEEWSV